MEMYRQREYLYKFLFLVHISCMVCSFDSRENVIIVVMERCFTVMRPKLRVCYLEIYINLQNIFSVLQVEDQTQHRHCICEDGTVQWCLFQIWGHHARKARLCIRWGHCCCKCSFLNKSIQFVIMWSVCGSPCCPFQWHNSCMVG